MLDSTTTITSLKELVKEFIEERDWKDFNCPKNMSMGIATEAAELMEIFMWVPTGKAWQELEKNRQAVVDEVADVAFSLLNFCAYSNIDLTEALKSKLIKNAQKYPVEKAKHDAQACKKEWKQS